MHSSNWGQGILVGAVIYCAAMDAANVLCVVTSPNNTRAYTCKECLDTDSRISKAQQMTNKSPKLKKGIIDLNAVGKNLLEDVSEVHVRRQLNSEFGEVIMANNVSKVTF